MSNAYHETSPTRHRVLNLRAVAVIVVTTLMMAGAGNWLHRAQLYGIHAKLAADAESALKADHALQALDLYEQLSLLKPGDPKIEEQISVLLEEHGRGQKSLLRAFQINERLLHDFPRDELRLRQIYIADRLRRYSMVRNHLRYLREKNTRQSDVWYFSGLVAEGTGDASTAIKYFKRAVTLENPKSNAFGRLADLLTDDQEPEQAERYLEQMIAEHDSASTRLVRSRWLLNRERPVEAIVDLKQSIEFAPADVTANGTLLNAIRTAASRDASFDAVSQYSLFVLHLSRVIANQPEEESRLRLFLASALWAEGRRDSAIECLKSGLERDPQAHRLREMLVDYLISHDRAAEAEEVFAELPARAISQSRRVFLKGRLQLARGVHEAASQLFKNALALAGDDSQVASRCRICLGLCYRNSGNPIRELDTYKDLIKTNPEFENGRLGLAAAYVRNNQISLAISEYRQLLHVDGVPAYLAGLLIRHACTLPVHEREWSEVEELVNSETSPIHDSVKRTLLQADLSFAQGFPSLGLDILDSASQRFPGDQRIRKAVRQLTSAHADGLNGRILKLLEENPVNMDAHMSILRLQLARRDTANMNLWLEQLRTGDACPTLSKIQRLLVIAEAATTVAEAETTVRGPSDQTFALLDHARNAWGQVTRTTPVYYVSYSRFLAIHESPQAALDAVRNAKEIPSGVKANSLLECLRQDPEDQEFRTLVGGDLVALITEEPANMDLRLAYADALLIVRDYVNARQVLTELSETVQDARAYGRLAWMAVFVSGDQEQALRMSEAATLRQPGDTSIRSIRALALAESGQADQALEVLLSIPDGQRTASSLLYEARAHQLAGREPAAVKMVQYLMLRSAALARPEVSLLKRMQEQLGVTTPRMTRR